MIPLATDTFTVLPPGGGESGPVRGHASLDRVTRTDGGGPVGIAQQATYTVLLDPVTTEGEAVTVTEESHLADSSGGRYRVETALRRKGSQPSLAHWSTRCTRITNDATADVAVDGDGNVLRVP